MATTISNRNVAKPAPRWFRKLKRATTILSDTACVMLLAMGQAENSPIILWCRIGISGLLTALEAALANDEVYAMSDQINEP